MFKLSQRKAGLFNSRTFLQNNFYAHDESANKLAMSKEMPLKNNLQQTIDDPTQFYTIQENSMFGHKRQLSLHKMEIKNHRRLFSNHHQHQNYSVNNIFPRSETEPTQVKELNGIESLNPEVILPKISPLLHFPKPYRQNTKFVDLLVKNKNLLRRGQFDMPLQHQKNKQINKSPSQMTPSKTNSVVSDRQEAILRSCSMMKKQLQVKRLKQSKREKKLRVIKKTAEKCAQQYQSIFEQQEKDPVKLKNTINRILAIKTIKNQLGFPA